VIAAHAEHDLVAFVEIECIALVGGDKPQQPSTRQQWRNDREELED